MIATPGNPYLMEKKPGLTLGGAEYSGRRPSPKLYEADNEVCRIEGASLSLHQEFYRGDPRLRQFRRSIEGGVGRCRIQGEVFKGCFSHSPEVQGLSRGGSWKR